jgi:hypothetical protein
MVVSGGSTTVSAAPRCSLDPRGTVDVTNRSVIATVVYGPTSVRDRYSTGNESAISLVDGCASTYDAALPGVEGVGFMVREGG